MFFFSEYDLLYSDDEEEARGDLAKILASGFRV
jgi:hypothetical protein